MIRLDQVADVAPRTPRPRAPADDRIAVVTLAAFDEERGVLRPPEITPFGEAVLRNLRTVQDGDVLLAAISPALENGKVAIARGLPGGVALASRELIVVRPTTVEPEWLHAFLRRRSVRELLRRTGRGSTERQRIAAETVARLQLTQRTRAQRRRALDRLDRLERIVARREGTAIAALTPLLAAQIRGKPTRLEALLAWSNTLTTSSQGGGTRFERGTAVLQERHLSDGVLELHDVETRRPARGVELRRGDLVVVTRASAPAQIGTTAVYEGKPPKAWAGSSLTRLALDDGSDPEWLWVWLNGPDARAQMQRACVRYADGARLRLKALAELRVPVPSLREQERIAARARRVRAAIGLARVQRDGLARLRDRLLDDTFGPVSLAPSSGVLAPPPPETERSRAADEQASVLWRRLAADQRSVWEAIRTASSPLPIETLAPSPAAHEQTRRTLKLLEAAGVVVKDLGHDVQAWRTPDADRPERG